MSELDGKHKLHLWSVPRGEHVLRREPETVEIVGPVLPLLFLEYRQVRGETAFCWYCSATASPTCGRLDVGPVLMLLVLK